MEHPAVKQQPNPVRNGHPSCHDLAIAQLERRFPGSPAIAVLRERKAFGLQKYGTPLQPFNGRNFGHDALQEAGDLVVYLQGRLYERCNARDSRLFHRALELLHELSAIARQELIDSGIPESGEPFQQPLEEC